MKNTIIIATMVSLMALTGCINPTTTSTPVNNACEVYNELALTVTLVEAIETSKLSAAEIASINAAQALLTTACNPNDKTIVAKEEALITTLNQILAEQKSH